ncbi:ABC transporter substrate-binding protein [Natrarchaeobius chitinivorans]|uniref:ABC transporter substrate-binding protein n=1 Tax=Natrarchaeobius chitinivorans TaxID=1679083 RepID=UPI00140429B7|nr:ABC transporter substrate-binding protein [Natrarchaeobius chitinivorans]
MVRPNRSAATDESSRTALSRRRLTQLAAGGAIAGLAGCTAFTDSGEDEVVRVASRNTISSVDPLNNGTILQRIGLTECLVRVDFEAELAPALAESWSVADDDVTWTFSLRNDATFHDGTHFDAEAAIPSLERAFTSSSLADVPFETVRATDEYELEIVTEEPFAPLPAYAAMREAAILGPDSYEDGDVVTPHATGPFQFDELVPEEEIALSRFDDYHGTVPAVEGVVYDSIPDNQTRALAVENGDAEMGRVLPSSAIDRFDDRDDVRVDVYEIPRMRCAQFNTRFAPFDDERVRQAASFAIDRESIANDLLEGIADTAVGPYPSVVEWEADDLEPYEHDLEQARSLLADAGWEATEDGVRRRDGEPLEIRVVTYPNRPALPDIATVLQDQLGEVGFDVDVEVIEVSAIHERAAEAADVVIWSANVYGWPADPDRLHYVYHSTEGGLHHGYDNERVDELLEEGRRAVGDPERRKELYDEVQRITMEEVPITYLTYYEMIVAQTTDLEGYDQHPTEYGFHLENVDLDR